MKSFLILLLLSFFLFEACNNPKPDMSGMKDASDTARVAESPKTDEAPPPQMDSAAMAKAYEAFMTPGDMHAMLAKWAGTWTGEVTSYWDPAAPEKSTATIKQRMAMNGLYQLVEYKGTMMGQPFEGQGVMAYDNAKKEFVNTWIDNMGSGILVMRGQWNEGTKTLSLKGTHTDPITAKDSEMRQEVKVIDDNNQLHTLYGAGPDGKEHKFMEIALKRA